MIDVALAILIGLYVWRRPQPATTVLWLAVVVLASRCYFEPVMTPYYLAPPLLAALVLAASGSGRRFWGAVVIAGELSIFAYFHLEAWAWWLPMVAGLTVVVMLARPRRCPSSPGLEPGAQGEHSVQLDQSPGTRGNGATALRAAGGGTARSPRSTRDPDDEMASV